MRQTPQSLPRPHPRIRLALPSSRVDLASIQHRFEIDSTSISWFDPISMPNWPLRRGGRGGFEGGVLGPVPHKPLTMLTGCLTNKRLLISRKWCVNGWLLVPTKRFTLNSPGRATWHSGGMLTRDKLQGTNLRLWFLWKSVEICVSCALETLSLRGRVSEVFRGWQRCLEVFRGFQRFFKGPLRDPLRVQFSSQSCGSCCP